MKKAFSLIELLISLVVISCLVAAFVPVVAAKILHKDISLNNAKMDCSKFDSLGRCLMCDKTKCNLCSTSLTVFGTDKYVNPAISCDAKPCSDHDINCKKCSSSKCTDCKIGYKLVDGKCIEVKCEPGQYKVGSSCVDCPEGTFRKEDNHTFDSCNKCNLEAMNCTKCSSITGICLGCEDGNFWDGLKCSLCDASCKTCVDKAAKCTSCFENYDLKDNKCTRNPCSEFGIEIMLDGVKYCFLNKNFFDDDVASEIKEVFDEARSAASETTSCSVTEIKTSTSHSSSNTSSNYCLLLSDVERKYECSVLANSCFCKRLAEKLGNEWRIPAYKELEALGTAFTNNSNILTSLNIKVLNYGEQYLLTGGSAPSTSAFNGSYSGNYSSSATRYYGYSRLVYPMQGDNDSNMDISAVLSDYGVVEGKDCSTTSYYSCHGSAGNHSCLSGSSGSCPNSKINGKKTVIYSRCILKLDE